MRGIMSEAMVMCASTPDKVFVWIVSGNGWLSLVIGIKRMSEVY
jgi:tRNA-binding EMAP/Myf-like protein